MSFNSISNQFSSKQPSQKRQSSRTGGLSKNYLSLSSFVKGKQELL